MTERCVGCGGEYAPVEGISHRYMVSSPACWERYGELVGMMAVDVAVFEARPYAVDAFAAQHPGTPGPQAIQSVAIHLLNMYEYLVLGHAPGVPRFAGPKGAFHWLTPPDFAGTRTVLSVPVDGPREHINAAARAWAESVWGAWSAHHAQIAAWHAQFSAR